MCTCAKVFFNFNYNSSVTSRWGKQYLGSVYLCQRLTRCLPQAHFLCSENVAIGFKTNIETYFVEKKTVLGCQSCSRLTNYAITFERNVFAKIDFSKIVPMSH